MGIQILWDILKSSKGSPTTYRRCDGMLCANNTKELDKNIKLKGCPSDLQDKVGDLVTKYWDVFCEDRFRQPIREISLQIDTGINSPI